MPLTNQEQKRYNRHIILHDIRIQGQEKIKETSILVVGAGGLGSPILYYLTAAGVATTKLKQLNPFTRITPYFTRLSLDNALEIISKYDIVMDATDNLHARYLINDACVKLGKPFVYGSICEFCGQVSVFNYQNGPTYRDLFEYNDEIENFSQPLGVIGALPGIVGSLQANEAIKIILEKTGVLSGKLLTIDILNNTYLTFAIRKKERREESLFK